MNREEFVSTFGGIYEHSPWVAEAAFDSGLPELPDAGQLVTVLRAQVDAAGVEAQLILLKAHPDLAGKLAMGGELTAESAEEQAGAGIDQCSPEEFERFQILNATYVEKFGFPFIMAVKGFDRHQILSAFEARVDNDKETEFDTALMQVHRIAEHRINTWLDSLGASE